jgi:hypothetical protein
MKYPIRNIVYERIRQAGNIMDSDILNALTGDNIQLSEYDINKILLDLEIYGLIKVSWITKDKRRIEAVVDSQQQVC